MIKIVIFIYNIRENLIDQVVDKNYLMIQKINTNNLTNFVVSSIKSLNHASHFVIDMTSLNDNNDEIVNSVNKLNTLYSEKKIVIIADDEKISKDLLRRIYNLGVYNIITNATYEELEYCILKGRTAEESKEFLIERPNLLSEKNEVKTLDKQQNNQSEYFEKVEEKIEVILPNKDFRKYKPYITVAICGAESHVGATHNALLITKFLNKIGFKTCYLEANEVQKIFFLKSMYPQNSNFNERKSLMQCFGIDIYSGFNISKVMEENYDFYVFDLGVLVESKLTSFLTKDIKIIVSGAKAWELKSLSDVVELIGNKNMVSLFLNLSVKGEQTKLQNLIETGENNLFFPKYIPNPFTEGVNIDIYKNVFKEYILQEEIDKTKKKKGIFNFKVR